MGATAADIAKHPCFRPEASRTWARLHLPVAPRCNVQCNFCDRKFSCVSESRPGVSADVLSPEEALARVERVLSEDVPLSVVGIAVNAVDPETAARMYSWVRIGDRTYRGLEAGQILVERQAAALREAAKHPFLVKVNTVVVPGVNDTKVGEIARRVAELGADLHNCIAMIPVASTPFGNIAEPNAMHMLELRAEAGHHLPQMGHCSRCRADACGLLGQGCH